MGLFPEHEELPAFCAMCAKAGQSRHTDDTKKGDRKITVALSKRYGLSIR